jgi:exodeoxyribonuclease V gamma subunit
VLRHPLQPFSRRYFERSADSDPRLFSFAGDFLPGVEAIANRRATAVRFFDEDDPLPLADEDLRRLRIDDLSRFFAMPCEHLLRRRLGIYLERAGDERAEDREPFALGDLERYFVGTSLLEGALAGRDLEAYFEVERGRGRLPLGVEGRRAYDGVAALAVPIATEVGAARAAGELDPLAVDIPLHTALGDTRLVGTLDGITSSARVQHSFGNRRAKRLLDVWIRHLALNCVAGEGHARRSIWIGRKDRGLARSVFEPLVEGADRLLAQLVELYWIGQQRPLEFFPATSLEYAYKLYRSQDDPDRAEVERQALVNAGGAWSNSWQPGGGESRNPAVARFFGGRRPFDEQGDPLGFRALAQLVYDPLLDGLEKATQAK